MDSAGGQKEFTHQAKHFPSSAPAACTRGARWHSLSSVAGRAETSFPRCLFVSVFECFKGKPGPRERRESGHVSSMHRAEPH